MFESSSAPVWYWDIVGYGKRRKPRVTFARVDSDRWRAIPYSDKMGIRVLRILANQDRPFPPGLEPEHIFRDTHDLLNPEDLQDFINIGSAAIRVSGRMIDLLREFELGETEIYELPFFEGKEDPPGQRPPNMVPDRDRPIPGRWGIVHVRARKVAFLPEQSKKYRMSDRVFNFPENPELMTWSHGGEKGHKLALDSAVAHTGPDLWRDPQTPDNLYFSDRLKSAMEAADLNIPVLKEFVKATLI